jgi:hypothetical protein
MYAIISTDPLYIAANYGNDNVPPYIIWPDKVTITAKPELGMTLDGYTFVNKIVVSSQPTSLHVADGATLSYDANTFTLTETINFVEPPLPIMQQAAKTRILEWRTIQQDSGFTFTNVVFQSDPLSRTNIEGAVQMAIIANMSNTAYTISWTASDNSQHDMDANTVIEFGVTAATTFQYWHSQALDLKNQINAANTANSIQSILDSVNA